jgi:serine/threonine protein kinase
VLGESVFDFLKSNGYIPYPPAQVTHISRQLCRAVAFMHESKLTHTDLKPENCLFATNDWYTVPPGAEGSSGNGGSIRKQSGNGNSGGGSGTGGNQPLRRMRDTRKVEMQSKRGGCCSVDRLSLLN